MSKDAFDRLYADQAAEAMMHHLDRQEIDEANLRARRAEWAEYTGIQHRIARWLHDTLQKPGATHLMLGSDGMRAIEQITSTAGPDTNIVVIEDNLTTFHDTINDIVGTPGPEKAHTVFLHLFATVEQERSQISRVFQHRANITKAMRRHRRTHKRNTPHIFAIADTPGGEAMTAMLDGETVDSASYNGTTLGLQRLVLDREAGEALAVHFDGHHGYPSGFQAMYQWHLRRAADTAYAHLKDGAPFVVHGSTHVPEHIGNHAALKSLTAQATQGMEQLWKTRRMIALRLLEGAEHVDRQGHNLLYAIELLRSGTDENCSQKD